LNSLIFLISFKGVIKVMKGSKEIRELNKGDSFGEQALYYNTARTCSCLASGDVRRINIYCKKKIY
jgi:cGMP-dependent protein kinase 1